MFFTNTHHNLSRGDYKFWVASNFILDKSDDEYKIIYTKSGTKDKTEIYDISVDAREVANIYNDIDGIDVQDKLIQMLDLKHEQASSTNYKPVNIKLDKNIMENLKALGYIQ